MPEQDLKVVALPIDMVMFDVEANIATISQRVRALPNDIDLIVLPELCFTGFSDSREKMSPLAQPNDGECITTVHQLSREKNAAIWGSFLAVDGDGHMYNRGFMVQPDGTAEFYDKHHLFCAGGEKFTFKAGNTAAPVVTFRSWKLTMAICYDLRFPVWMRCQDYAYDAMIVPANWPHVRFYAWDTLLRARAIENQCYVVGCDREGEDNYGVYDRGDSRIIDPRGKVISTVDEHDGTTTAIFDANLLNRTRANFPTLSDADPFTLL